MQNHHDSESTAADIAIVGLGPGGLAAALYAADSGKTVIAFTDRTEYIRGQWLSLSETTSDLLRQYTDYSDLADRMFWKKLEMDGMAQTKDIERFLYRKLVTYPNVTIVNTERAHPITAVGRGESGSADFIQLSQGEQYFCRNILEADGARHSFAEVVNQGLGSNIQYVKRRVQERHPYHAVVQLKLKDGESIPATMSYDLAQYPSLYRSQGWTKFYKPNRLLFANATNKKFYFAGEIPKEIYEAPEAERRDRLKKWASVALLEQYGISEDQLEYRSSKKTPQKDRLQATVFEMNMVYSTRPVVDLSNGVFAQIGDARSSPNYFLGHGLNDAVEAGIVFASSLEKKSCMRIAREMDAYIEGNINSYVNKSVDSIEDPAFVKLIKSIDNLMTQLKDHKGSCEEEISKLELAKQTLINEGNPDQMYQMLRDVQPIAVEQNRSTLLYCAFLVFISVFHSQAKMIKYPDLVEDIRTDLGKLFPKHQ